MQVIDECHHSYDNHPFNDVLAHYRHQSPVEQFRTQVSAKLVCGQRAFAQAFLQCKNTSLHASSHCRVTAQLPAQYSYVGSGISQPMSFSALYMLQCAGFANAKMRLCISLPMWHADHWTYCFTWDWEKFGKQTWLSRNATSISNCAIALVTCADTVVDVSCSLLHSVLTCYYATVTVHENCIYDQQDCGMQLQSVNTLYADILLATMQVQSHAVACSLQLMQAKNKCAGTCLPPF